jgi:thymidylate synthase (FAD)
MKPLSATDLLALDSRLRVEVLSSTINPQRLMYANMRQDYSEGAVADDSFVWDPCKPDSFYGDLVVKHCLSNERGHYGVVESPVITFNVIGFPHSVVSQARTHRIGTSFDVTSMRYTSKRFLDTEKYSLEDVIYIRPVGHYDDRNGHRYDFTQEWRQDHLERANRSRTDYAVDIDQGMAPEHGRDRLEYGFRQNFNVTFNARSVLHFLDLRSKLDAQLEIVALSHLLFEKVKIWIPEVATYYEQKRLGKARLAP